MAGRPEQPIDPGAGPAAQFAFELRELRRQAGGPTYRQMARLANYSASTLSMAVSGKSIPSLPVTLAYVRACGGDEDQWRTRWQEATAQTGADADPAVQLEPAVQPDSAVQPEPPVQADPAEQPEPAEQGDPAEQPDPVEQPELTEQLGPAEQPELAGQPESAEQSDLEEAAPGPSRRGGERGRDRRLIPVKLRAAALGGVLVGVVVALALTAYAPGRGPGRALPGPTSTVTMTAGPQPTAAPTSAAPSSTPAARPVAATSAARSPSAAPSKGRPGPGATSRPATPSSGARYGFEGGTQGWGSFYGHLSVTTTSSTAYQGARSLRLAPAGSGYSAVGLEHPPGVRGGTVITYEVWSDGRHSGSLTPFAQSTDYTDHFVSGATISLPRSGWTRLTWTVPQVSVLAIGLQIHSDGDGLTTGFDSVTW